MKNIILILAVLSITACGKTIEYRTIELERPARPVLPNLSIEKAQLIDAETWTTLVQRHRMMRHYAEQLEVIIDATKGKK